MKAVEQWWATAPAAPPGYLQASAAWRAAVEACAKQVEAAGCLAMTSPTLCWLHSDGPGGLPRRPAAEPAEHEAWCPIALAAALREGLA